MQSTDWETIVTSAAVASFVSTGITAFGQYLERRARRSELLLKHAVELAFARRKVAMRIAEKDGKVANLVDDVLLTERYYQSLGSLLEHGRLPLDVEREQNSDHVIEHHK
ncbi:MAG TPA: hypothetical protein VK550_34730 [Polyangiaceae bacterium]|nr:hypothetical protein [Polyangiaceae bacterium]